MVNITTSTIRKIKKAENGNELLTKALEILNRENTEYNRGVIHGFLLALSTQGIIDGDDALDILMNIER